MKKEFVLRVIDNETGIAEVLTLDLNLPLHEQLKTVSGRPAHMKLFVSHEKDYDVTTVYEIMKALGGKVKMEMVADTPETTGVNADLYLEN